MTNNITNGLLDWLNQGRWSCTYANGLVKNLTASSWLSSPTASSASASSWTSSKEPDSSSRLPCSRTPTKEDLMALSQRFHWDAENDFWGPLLLMGACILAPLVSGWFWLCDWIKNRKWDL